MERISIICSKISQFTLLTFVFLLPLVILPGAMHKFAIAKLTLFRLTAVIVLVSWLVKAISERKVEFRYSPLNLPIAVFLAANIISAIFSLSPSLSFTGAFFQRQEGLVTLFGYIVLFFATTYFLGEKNKLLTVIKVFAFSSLLVSLYGLAQYLGYDIFSYRLYGLEKIRSFSTLGNPDFLGSYLVIALPLNLGLILISRDFKDYALGIAAFLSVLLALVFSFTRGAWIGAFLGLAVMIFYTLRIKTIGKKAMVLLIVVVLALGFVLAINVVGAKRGFSIWNRIASSITVVEGSSGVRLLMWRDTIKVINERILLGWGPETFKDVFFKYRGIELSRRGGKGGYVERPHNQTLYMAASAGVLGVMGYIWLITAFFLLITSRIRTKNSPFNGLKLGILGSGLGYFFQEQFLFSFVSVTPLFWMVLGFAVCLAGGSNPRKLSFGLNFLQRRQSFSIFVVVLFGLLALAFSFSLMEADLQAGAGRDAIAAGNLQVAASSLQKAIKLNPWEPRYRYYMGAVCSDLGIQTERVFWFKQAEEVYLDGLKLNPYDSILSLGLGDVYYHISQVESSSDYTLALGAYEKTIELNPFSKEAHLNLGNIFLSQGEYSKSIKHFETSLRISPDDVKALIGVARVYEEKGGLAEAKRYFKKALKYDIGNRAAMEGIRRVEGKISNIEDR